MSSDDTNENKHQQAPPFNDSASSSHHPQDNIDSLASTPPVHAVSLKLPQFWVNSPATWFVQAEAQFSISKITADKSRYYYVLAALPQEVIESIIDFVQTPPEENFYEGIKKLLVERHSLSEENRIERIISSEVLGDRKPSDFFRTLKRLAGGTINDVLIRKLWLRRLPQAINLALISHNEMPISDVMTLADKIWEATKNVQLYAISPSDSSPPSNISKLQKEMKEIKLMLNKLTTQDSRSRQPNRSVRFRSSSRSRTDSQARSSSRTRDKDICWYHTKFGDKASKCTTPCKYKSETASNSKN